MGDIVLYIMVLFSIIGGVDKLLGNRRELGEKFDEAFRSMGSLTLSMVGIIGLAPFISQILSPFLMKLSNLTGADPSIFISSILASDLGGYTSSIELAQSQKNSRVFWTNTSFYHGSNYFLHYTHSSKSNTKKTIFLTLLRAYFRE